MRIPFAWRGWPFGCETVLFGEGDAIDANSIRLLKGGILWRNPIPCWGTPLEENSILVEEGAPLQRILLVMEREGPLCEYHSLGEGNPLEGGKPLAGDYHSLGGDAPIATPFAVERGDCWGERHSLDEWRRGPLGQEDSSMKQILFALGTGTLMLQSQSGQLLTKGTSLMLTASGSREISDIGEWNS